MTNQPSAAYVARNFDLAPERLFDAWTNPELIGQWMFGSNVRDEVVVGLSVDLRVGGRFSFVVDRQATRIDHSGQYVEIVRPRRLVFSWSAAIDGKPGVATPVTIDIRQRGQGANLQLTHVMHPSWSQFKEQAEQAWMKLLDSLAKHVT